MKKQASVPPEYFGGQALIEGVMMQGNAGYSVAARTPQGRIVCKQERRKRLKDSIPLLGLPMIRGIVAFCESMYVGFGTLTWSAFQAGEEEEEQLSWKELAVAIVSALLLTILFFVILPVFAASFSLNMWGLLGAACWRLNPYRPIFGLCVGHQPDSRYCPCFSISRSGA